jgi:hypothetical protein
MKTIPIVMTALTEDALHPQTRKFIKHANQPLVLATPLERITHPEPDKARCLNIALGRTQALREAEKEDCEYFFFLDADVVPPMDAIEMLLDNEEADVVGGWIPARFQGMIGGRWLAEGLFTHFSREFMGLTVTHLISLGCTLVRRFLIEGYVFDAGIDVACRDVFGHSYHIADSGAFSRDMRNKGATLWLDSDVICQHLCQK